MCRQGEGLEVSGDGHSGRSYSLPTNYFLPSSRRSRGLGHHRSPVPSTELACRPRAVLTACPWEVSLPEARARVGPAAVVSGVVSSESCLIIGVLGPP